MTRDLNNRLYVANNEGLLVLNGTNWQVFPVPNKTILRSISFGPGDKLYAGAQDEIGYFAADKVGRLQFTSLKKQLPPAERNFTDVWDIEVTGTDVFFRTDQKIFLLQGEKFTVYPAHSTWVSLHQHQGRILAQDSKTGLWVYENSGWQTLLSKDSLPSGFLITDIVPFTKDTSLLSTTRHGLYWFVQKKLIPLDFTSPVFNPLQHFTSLSVINDSSFLAGTYFNGIYHITSNGQVAENISAQNGLPNNTVRFVFDDKNGNAWAGLDNGLAFFSYNNPIRHINPPAFNNGAGYHVTSVNGDLYFALSTGLQWVPVASAIDLSAISYEPRTIIGGLTWNLSLVGDQLFAGRDDGLWNINNRRAVPVSQTTGYWSAKVIRGSSPRQILAGNYTGIEKYQESGGQWNRLGTVDKFNESSRYVETADNTLWISHPYRGVYKIDLTTDAISLFTREKGLPADLDNHVFKIKNKIVFATAAGIYEYDAVENRIIKATDFATLFGNRPIRYLQEDEKGNIWFIQDKMAGVADYSAGKPVIHYIPELKNKILSGFENIFPYNTKNILVGSEAGFYHINYEKYRENIKPFSAYITLIKTIGRTDSVLYGGFGPVNSKKGKTSVIPFRYNSLHFAYAASLPGIQTNREFSYFLEGFDEDWSGWSGNTGKDYTNLPAGSYTFRARARTSPSHESEEAVFYFTIRPPWHQTLWAYALFILFFTGILVTLFVLQAKKHKRKQEVRRLADQKQFEEEQKQIAYRHQLELAKSEKELIRLQNEKLGAEIAHKNAELASTTMNLVHKKEFILKLKSELQQLQKTIKAGDENPELKKLLKVLAEEEKLDEEWNNFSQHFNSVHGDFLTILKTKYPALKPHELRLCAYLRMNLSSKEIAPLMSISIRGVEIGRYRLRKKLALPTEVNLVQFLMALS